MTDWEYEKTINTPTVIKIQYAVSGASGFQKKEVALQSTTWTENTTNYVTVQYADRAGEIAEEDVAISRYSLTRNTAAAVNGAFVKWRLSNSQGLPTGDANRESTTTYEYVVTLEGPVLVRERVEEWISEYEFAGSLNIDEYTGVNPTAALIRSSVTITDYTQATDYETGRAHTKTSTTRYLAMGLTQEGQQSAASQMKEDDGDGVIITKVFNSMKELICDGTEVRTSIGRAPKPSRPAAQELLAEQIAEASQADSTGSWERTSLGSWPQYVPPEPVPLQVISGGSTSSITSTTTTDGRLGIGERTILALQDDSVAEDLGTVTYEMPWAPDDYVTMGDWRDLDQDSDGDGVPDWADYVPDGWEDYDQDSDGDGVPDWAAYVPDQWQDFDQDSDGDGVPDWAPFVPGPWQDFDQDSDSDGVPDWAEYVPTGTPQVEAGGAASAATEFGETLNALRIGNGFGANVTTTGDRLPPDPFAPIYLNVGGLSVAMRLNGTSWAFDGSGVVASSDLMLCGVSGRTATVSSSWVRLPVAPSGLPLLDPPSEPTSPEPAYTTAAPMGFDPTAPGSIFDSLSTAGAFVPVALQTADGIVPPYLVKESVYGVSRHRISLQEFPYLLEETETVQITTRTTVEVRIVVIVPVSEIVTEVYAPRHEASVVQRLPVADQLMEARVPVVGNAVGTYVDPPSVTISVGASGLRITDPQQWQMRPASALISVDDPIPAVGGGIGFSLQVPAAVTSVVGPVPVVPGAAWHMRPPSSEIAIAAPAPTAP